MSIDESQENFFEPESEFEKSFDHLFRIIAKDLKAAAKAHDPKSLSKRVTHNPKEPLDN